MKQFCLISVFVFFFQFISFATHMRAGEITYRHISGLTYEATIVTYTYALSHADRCQLTIEWGDGSSDNLPRTNGPSGPNINGDYCDHLGEIIVTNYIRKNTYIGTHTYAGYGDYIISMEDPNRNEGIVNIPYSVNVPFFVESELVINPFLGFVDSPIMVNPPIDDACINEPYIYNPGAYDPDGDSLSYRLIPCKGDGGLNIPGYTYPATSKVFTLDSITGNLFWDTPIMQGEYNVAILIEQWRNGIKVGSVTRDMQILVVPCDNQTPVINNINDTCVEAGTLLKLNVNANDPDNDSLLLNASGGPFVVADSASFTQNTIGKGNVNAQFLWLTNCSLVRRNPYPVYFTVTDEGYPINLVNVITVNITVVAPAPSGLKATPNGNNILLSWNKSICNQAIGYRIYRKEGCTGVVHGTCETGVPASSGYNLIADVDSSQTSYLDNGNDDGLTLGISYSYVIIAYFPDGAESYVSDQVCATLQKNVPVITNVSVRTTDATNGSMYVVWSKPMLDTTQINGPFQYLIYRSDSINALNYSLINSLAGINDTTYIDTLLNTTGSQYNYKIELYNDTTGNRFLIGNTRKASSVFLTIIPTDHKLSLSWNEIVPWINNSYVVYKQNDNTLLFDSIATVTAPLFADSGLINGKIYCYLVKSIGGYPVIQPLYNFSQKVCITPVDNVPPCPPHLTVIPNCENKVDSLIWSNENKSCANDIASYKIYFSSTEAGDFVILSELNNAKDTIFVHPVSSSLAGCYFVSAIDSSGNESKNNEQVCVDSDSCKLFRLPNVFTPNGDGVNDLFVPFPYDFVDYINIDIFNRWGNLVFSTTNPQIQWDGKDHLTHVECPDGVYFYVCDVYESHLKGVTKRRLTGYIQIIR